MRALDNVTDHVTLWLTPKVQSKWALGSQCFENGILFARRFQEHILFCKSSPAPSNGPQLSHSVLSNFGSSYSKWGPQTSNHSNIQEFKIQNRMAHADLLCQNLHFSKIPWVIGMHVKALETPVQGTNLGSSNGIHATSSFPVLPLPIWSRCVRTAVSLASTQVGYREWLGESGFTSSSPAPNSLLPYFI